ALPWWLTILVVGRDVGIIMTALLISLVAGYRPFRPTILGKVSTATQVVTVFAAVCFQAHVPFVRGTLVQICVYLAAALTVASGIYYGIVVRKRYGQHASEEAGAN